MDDLSPRDAARVDLLDIAIEGQDVVKRLVEAASTSVYEEQTPNEASLRALERAALLLHSRLRALRQRLTATSPVEPREED